MGGGLYVLARGMAFFFFKVDVYYCNIKEISEKTMYVVSLITRTFSRDEARKFSVPLS